MSESIKDSLDRALQSAFTRPPPKGAGAQMRYLVKQLKSTKAVAQLLGVSQRTVERYVAGKLKRPRAALAGKMQREVTKRWQPQVRAKARKQAGTTGGLVVTTKAYFGFESAAGSTDDWRRNRALPTQVLTPALAERVLAAWESGETESELKKTLGNALGEVYFRAGGTRAHDLKVKFTDIDELDIEL